MKIGEAKLVYKGYLEKYQEHRQKLNLQHQELKKKMEDTPDGKTIYAKEAAVLELSMEALNKQQEVYQNYMGTLNDYLFAYQDFYAAEQQGEAMAEGFEDMGKIMEVARRIMDGDIVPPEDEKKLMEFSSELYQAAKNMGAMAKNKEKKEYESLWADEEETEYEDPAELAENTEIGDLGPAYVAPADVVEAVVSDL